MAARLVCMILASVNARSIPTADSVVDFCVSSRWGFSCLSAKRSRPLIDLSGGRMAMVTQQAGRSGARGALVIIALAAARELIRDVRNLRTDMSDPITLGWCLQDGAREHQWAGLANMKAQGSNKRRAVRSWQEAAEMRAPAKRYSGNR